MTLYAWFDSFDELIESDATAGYVRGTDSAIYLNRECAVELGLVASFEKNFGRTEIDPLPHWPVTADWRNHIPSAAS